MSRKKSDSHNELDLSHRRKPDFEQWRLIIRLRAEKLLEKCTAPLNYRV